MCFECNKICGKLNAQHKFPNNFLLFHLIKVLFFFLCQTIIPKKVLLKEFNSEIRIKVVCKLGHKYVTMQRLKHLKSLFCKFNFNI